MNPEEEQLMQSIMPSIFECELESETSATPSSSQKGPSAFKERRPFSTAADDCSSDSGGSDTICMPWGTFPAAPQVTCPDLSGLPYLLSNISKYQASNSEDDQASKKQKVEWTEDLHVRFVRVVNSLGPEKAVPSKILELMGPSAAGLTRQNVASHLQKFRHRKRPRLQCSASAPHSVVTGMPVWPQCPSPIMVPGVTGCQGVWTPSAAALQNLTPTIPSHQLHASTVAQQVTSAIAQVLEAPKSQLPIGLKLDPASVLSQYKSASARASQ